MPLFIIGAGESNGFSSSDDSAGAAFFCCGLGFAGAGAVALELGLPDIDAPQNGHSVASSSMTDCLQDGHVGKAIFVTVRGKVQVENLC